MIDALGQIDAVIEQHVREIERLQVARSVLLELTANPNRVKGAVIESKNRSEGITIRRIGSVPEKIITPAKETAPAPKKRDPKAQEINADLSARILQALEKHGPLKSKELGTRAGLKKGQDRQRLYQRLYDLKQRGKIQKLDDQRYVLVPSPPPVEEASQDAA